MSKHTPGPWSASPSSGTKHHGIEAQVWDSNGKALIFLDEDRCIGPEADANARLIAAAPDLLAACHTVWPWVLLAKGAVRPEAHSQLKADLDQLTAAINKAEGDSQ